MKETYLLLGIALCGAVGAVARYTISAWVNQSTSGPLPFGTLVVNVLGCLLIGALMEWEILSDSMPGQLRLVVTAGFLGALTTFSTFGYETLGLWERSGWHVAAANVLLNVVVGLLAVGAGAQLMKGILTD